MVMEEYPSRPSGTLGRREFLAAGAASLGLLAGCVTRGQESNLDGRVIIDGSNTVLPVSSLLAYEFQWRNNSVQIPVRGSGTGAGFQRFCNDETDIQNASRAVTDGELRQCRDNGVEPIELEAALDGIALMTHPDNDWCDELTAEELRELWRSGSPIETWSDLREEWPDEEIQFFGRGTASGTFDAFTEIVTGQKGNIRNDYSASQDTNVIVRGVRGDRYAIGFGGAGFYYENQDDLGLVAIREGEDGEAVLPTRETIESREYFLSRPMFIYVNTNSLEREVVREFVRFMFEEVDDEILEQGRNRGTIDEDEGRPAYVQWAAREVGFYAIDEETITASKDTLEEKITEVTR